MRMFLWILASLSVILLAIAGAVTFGLWNFDRLMNREAQSLLDDAQAVPETVITEEDLAGLPEPVQRYLRFSGVVGKPPIHNAIVRQEGGFRTSQERPWMPFTARETYTVNPPGFIWQARISIASVPILTVRDYYRAGEGGILAKVGGLVAMADQRADEASLMRYFNELMWLPSAYLGDNVTWTPVDDVSALGTMTDQGMTVTALLTFGEDGRIVNFEAERLFSGSNNLQKWATPIEGYGEFGGYRLPVRGKGVWLLEDGDFAYIDLQITGAEYNVTGVSQ